MSETDNAHDGGGGGEGSSFTVPMAKVVDGGRITIPSKYRNEHNISENDIVDIRVTTADDVFIATDVPVDSQGRVRILQTKRDLYDVRAGDLVELDVSTTDMTLPED